MNPRIAIILVVLLAILGGGALVYQQQESARRPDNVANLGRVLLKGLQAADITTIRIVEPKSTLTLQRTDAGWVIPERGNFPADFDRVREFVIKAISLKAGQSEPVGEKDRARLNLDATGTQLEFNAADGKTLGKLVIGKKYFKRDVDNAEKALGDGRFVALPAETKLVYVVSDPLTQANARSADWIDRSSFQVEKVRHLEVRYPGGGSWRIDRNGDNANWRLSGAGAGDKLDISKANAAAYTLSLFELADIAPKDVKDTGLDKPALINASTLDGLSYAIKVGKVTGDNVYVSFTSTGAPAANAKDAERLKKLNERLPREKLLSKHILLIAKSKFDDTLKLRAELLEKKEDRKK